VWITKVKTVISNCKYGWDKPILVSMTGLRHPGSVYLCDLCLPIASAGCSAICTDQSENRWLGKYINYEWNLQSVFSVDICLENEAFLHESIKYVNELVLFLKVLDLSLFKISFLLGK
jgi:hypothetical protein